MKDVLEPLKSSFNMIVKLEEDARIALIRARESRYELDGLIYRTFERGASAREIAEVLGVSSVATIYRRVEKYKQKAGLKSDTTDSEVEPVDNAESQGGF